MKKRLMVMLGIAMLVAGLSAVSALISMVANGIDPVGYSSAIKYTVTGAILLAAVTLDTISRRRLARSGR